jgi:putative transcriptional regulator
VGGRETRRPGHLDLCEHCRVAFGLAEAVGGALLDELPPAPLSPGRAAAGDGTARRASRSPGTAGRLSGSGRRRGKGRYAAAWPARRAPALARARRAARRAAARADGGTLRLLRVRPGTALPRHAHRGTELTLVLEGAFSDETGRHGPGDLVEVEGEESHRPVAEGTADCVCLVATEGRLRFGGLLGALFGAVARV